MKNHRLIQHFTAGRVVLGLVVLFAVLVICYPLPSPLFVNDYSTVLYDRHAQLLGARIAGDEQWRFPLPDSLPENYVTALLTFEDKRFFNHGGLDLISLSRALRENYRAGKVVSGGSTLSMQVVRLSTARNQPTVWRKIWEIFGAIKLEHRYSKDEILRWYAAHAPFGGNVVGLEAACWRYFSKSPEALSWAETALLAVLPNSPALIHPGRNRALLLAKRDKLLHRLLLAGHLDEVNYRLSLLEPLPDQPESLPDLTPHLTQQYLLEKKGQRVVMDIDASLQRRMVPFVNQYMQTWEQNHVYNAAVLVMDTRTGQVLGYVGNSGISGDMRHGRQVDVVKAPRSSGSILKPFLYNAMIHHGHILPGALVDDIPLFFGSYRPVNFNPVYDGVVPADVALIRSLNVPAVNMLHQYGVENFHRDLNDLGFSTITRPPGHYGLSLILGGAENTLWDVCQAYRQLASKLLVHSDDLPEKNVLKQSKSSISLCYEDSRKNYAFSETLFCGAIKKRSEMHSPEKTTVSFSPASIYLTFKAMQQVARPEAMQMWSRFEAGRPIAWKTGTSIGFRDAWAVGVTPDYIVGTWVGNADGTGRPDLTGIQAAAPLMFDIFRMLPVTQNSFDIPQDELQLVNVCAQSGMLTSENCPVSKQEYIPYNVTNAKVCPYHVAAWVDKQSGLRVHTGCSEPTNREMRNYFVLPPRQAYFYQLQNPGYTALPVWNSQCELQEASQRDRVVSMIYPVHDATIQLTRNLDGKLQPLMLQAASNQADMAIYWHLNEQYLGVTSQYHTVEVYPGAGVQLLKLTPAQGQPVVIRFTVVERG